MASPIFDALLGRLLSHTHSGSGGLADPGGNGVVKRTALNTTAVAAAADVAGLFIGEGDYLKSDGTRGTPTSSLPEISFSFSANGDAYYVAPSAMVIETAYVGGSGTLSYAKALAADTTSFSADPLPVTLAQGDVLKVTVASISGYCAVTLVRSA